MNEWEKTIENLVAKESYEEYRQKTAEMVGNLKEQGLDLEEALTMCYCLADKEGMRWLWPFMALSIKKAWEEST